MSNVKCQMSKGGENSQISYAEKSSLILDLILWFFDHFERKYAYI